MPHILFLDAMDAMVGHGCANPDCTHEHDDEAMALTSRCHPATGVCIGFTDQVGDMPCALILQCACWTCHTAVGFVAVGPPFTKGPGCRHRGAMDVLYQDGRVTITCRRCDSVAVTCTVAALPDEDAA
jgi:prepilin-type processing-associated H-X9-DG protein